MLRTSPRTNNTKTSSPRSRAWWSKRGSEDSNSSPEPRKATKSTRQRRNSLSPRYSPVNDPRVVSFLESNALVTGPDGVVVRPGRHTRQDSKALEIESSRWKQVHSPPTQEVQGLGLTSASSKDSRPNLKKSLTMLVKMPSFSSKNNASPKSPHQKSKSEDLRPTWQTEDYRPRPYDLRPFEVKPQTEEHKPLPITRKMSDLDELAKRYQNMMEIRGESKALPSLPTPPETPPQESEVPLLLMPQTYSGSPTPSTSDSESEPEPILRKSRAQRFGTSLESKALKQIDEQGIHPLQSHPWNYLYQDTPHEPQAAEISSSSSSTASESSNSPKTFSIGSLSPQSDVTLVEFPSEFAFQKDAIYFKPVSFGPTPPATPPQEYKTNGKFDADQSTIGLGMLAQDMVCSLADASPRSDNKFDKMQVTIMIETYERLRDNMATMGVSQDEMNNAKAVFDCWLSALNSIRCAMGDDNECAWI